MAEVLTNDFNEYDGISKLFNENVDSTSSIDEQIKDIEKSRLKSDIGEKKKKSSKKNFKGKSHLKKKKQIESNDIKQLDKKILELMEKRRNIQRMRARKEHNDPNWESQGTKICKHFNSRSGCKYGRQCDMKHPTIVTDLTESIFQSFITVLNAPTEEQVAFLERSKKRPQHFYRGISQQYYRSEIPQFYSRGKSNFNFRSNSKYKGKYKNTENKSED